MKNLVDTIQKRKGAANDVATPGGVISNPGRIRLQDLGEGERPVSRFLQYGSRASDPRLFRHVGEHLPQLLIRKPLRMHLQRAGLTTEMRVRVVAEDPASFRLFGEVLKRCVAQDSVLRHVLSPWLQPKI